MACFSKRRNLNLPITTLAKFATRVRFYVIISRKDCAFSNNGAFSKDTAFRTTLRKTVEKLPQRLCSENKRTLYQNATESFFLAPTVSQLSYSN